MAQDREEDVAGVKTPGSPSASVPVKTTVPSSATVAPPKVAKQSPTQSESQSSVLAMGVTR